MNKNFISKRSLTSAVHVHTPHATAETARLEDALRRERKQRQRGAEALEAALLRNGSLENEINELRFSNRKLKVRFHEEPLAQFYCIVYGRIYTN